MSMSVPAHSSCPLTCSITPARSSWSIQASEFSVGIEYCASNPNVPAAENHTSGNSRGGLAQIPASIDKFTLKTHQDFSELTSMWLYQSIEKPLCCFGVSPLLDIDIDYLSILVNSPPKVVLLSVDLYENFINKECVTLALMTESQPLSISLAKLDAP